MARTKQTALRKRKWAAHALDDDNDSPVRSDRSSPPGLPDIDPTELRDFLLRKDFERYSRAKSLVACVFDTTFSKEEFKIIAKVSGSHARSFYRITVEFCREPQDKSVGSLIKDWGCTCPDWGNPCKHISAVLMRYSDCPEEPSKPSLSSLLQNKTREELVQLIHEVAASDRSFEKAIYRSLTNDPQSDDSEEMSDGEYYSRRYY